MSDWLSVADYPPVVVTVPAPLTAPTLSAKSMWNGSCVAGSVYGVACTYVSWWGETTLGPAVYVTAVNKQGIAVLPRAPLGTRAYGARIYMNRDGGSWRQAPSAPDAQPKVIGFGDETAFGGALVYHDPSGSAPPSSSICFDQDGTAIAAPTLAPLAVTVGALPPTTTLYGAYSYVGEDGQETALSPASSAVTTLAGGGYLNFVVTQEPPSGAVFVNLYLGPSATDLRRQLTNQPLHHVTSFIHSFDAAGPAPLPSTPQSTISGFQQAYDQVMANGGGSVLVPPGPWETKVPLLPRQLYQGSARVGVRIWGSAGHDANGSSCLGRISYIGALSGVELVVCSAQSLTVENLDFADPLARVKYGLAFADFTGGGAFTSGWTGVGAQARMPGGIGRIIDARAQGPSSHTASEQYFERCSFSGAAWGSSQSGGQTGDIRDHNCHLSGGDSNGANSGDTRSFTPPLWMDGINFSGYGQHMIYLTDDSSVPGGGGGNPHCSLGAGYVEFYNGGSLIYVSALATNGPRISVGRLSWLQNHRPYPILAAYLGGPARLTLDGNIAVDGNVFGGHVGAAYQDRWPACLKGAVALRKAPP